MKYCSFLHAVCLAFLGVSFVACGGEIIREETIVDGENIFAEEVDSLDELPACTAKRAGMLSKVEDSYYACYSRVWRAVEKIVQSSCDIQTCSEKTDGQVYYVEQDEKALQCRSGSWYESDGTKLSKTETAKCSDIRDDVVTVSSIDSLKSCTAKREGNLAYVMDVLYVCSSRRWQKQVEVDGKNAGSSSSSAFSGTSSTLSSSSSVDDGYIEKDDDDSGEEGGSTIENSTTLLPPAGFYSGIEIPVPVPESGGNIRCTTNGAAPTISSPTISTPLSITKNTVVRCTEFVGSEPVRTSTQTYFIGENVTMPVVAISVDPYEMFDSRVGYYSQGVSYCSEPCYEANYWQDRELPVHVEFFENGSSTVAKNWEIDAGISIIGQWSRYRAKKSVAIKMKKEYQDGRLKYPLFKTRPEAKKFKAFNLRNGGNRFVGDYIEDPMLTSLMEGSSVDYQRSRQVVVYYNGSFHGIYDMRERLNEHFIETNYGIDSKQVDMVKHVGTEVTASGGTADAYLNLLNFVHTSNFSGANNQKYSQIVTMMDVGNFADYMAAEIYIHNGDWPNNNVRAWRTADQPFKFPIFDVDHGFGWDWAVSGFSNSTNMFRWINAGGGNNCTGLNCFAEIYIKLIQNPDFKRLFINHSAVMLDYYLTYDRVVAATNAMTASIGTVEMQRDQQLYPRTEHVFDATGSTLISYAYSRTSTVKSEYRAEFDLGSDISVTIASQGSGKVLVDGMTLPSTNYTGKFFAGNDMLLEAVASGTAMFTGWTDGNTQNPRLVSPVNGDKFTAKFQ